MQHVELKIFIQIKIRFLHKNSHSKEAERKTLHKLQTMENRGAHSVSVYSRSTFNTHSKVSFVVCLFS